MQAHIIMIKSVFYFHCSKLSTT